MRTWMPSSPPPGRERPADRQEASIGNLDVALVFVALAALLVDPVLEHRAHDVSPLASLLALVTSLPLVERRRRLLGVLATVVPLLLVCLAVFHPNRAAGGIVMLVVFTIGCTGAAPARSSSGHSWPRLW